MSQQHIKIITYQVKVDFIPEVFKIMREIKERNRKLNMNSASFFFFLSMLLLSHFSHVLLCATPWTTGHQASLSITNSGSLLKFMSIESVMPSNHLILCCPLPLLSLIFPSIRVFFK